MSCTTSWEEVRKDFSINIPQYIKQDTRYHNIGVSDDTLAFLNFLAHKNQFTNDKYIVRKLTTSMEERLKSIYELSITKCDIANAYSDTYTTMTDSVEFFGVTFEADVLKAIITDMHNMDTIPTFNRSDVRMIDFDELNDVCSKYYKPWSQLSYKERSVVLRELSNENIGDDYRYTICIHYADTINKKGPTSGARERKFGLVVLC